MTKKIKLLSMLLALMFIPVVFSSCGGDDDDDEPISSNGLVGYWTLEEVYDSDDGDIRTSVKMTLKFNKDNSGEIVEELTSESRASTHKTYTMKFSWSTTSDSNGNDILRVSYISGDKTTMLFPGSSNTVLWTRRYVRTGNILNVYCNDGVLVFNKN
ncbi:MAG: hypothetical protein J6C78_06245 [Muribaculaceae bacterium]|nr:hypothetical protein [Muribaculaceae bacterium]